MILLQIIYKVARLLGGPGGRSEQTCAYTTLIEVSTVWPGDGACSLTVAA